MDRKEGLEAAVPLSRGAGSRLT